MADTYTPNLDLTLMARGDRNWDATLNAILTTLDGQQALGALAVRPAEDGPSASLNVKISAGTFRASDGTAVAVAATASLALAASSTSSIYLTDAGVVTVSTAGFPASTSIVPLAVVTTGAGTVTAIADARRPLTSFGADEHAWSQFTVSGGAAAIDWSASDRWYGTLASGANALSFAGVPAAGKGRVIQLRLTQPATGAAGTVTWPAGSRFPGGASPALSTANAAVDVLSVSLAPDGGFDLFLAGTGLA